MWGAIAAFPYLFASVALALTAALVAHVTLSSAQRRITLLSGLIGFPAGLLAPSFEDAYWSPQRLGGGAVGLEDLVVSFAAAAVAWYLVAVRFQHGMGGAHYAWPVMMGRVLRVGGGTVGTFLVLDRVVGDPMSAALLCCCLATLALLSFGTATVDVDMVVWGAVAFAATWFVFVRIVFALSPLGIEQWSVAGPWGMPLAGVPVGEIAWAGAFGAYWAAFVPYVLGVTLNAPPTPAGMHR